MIQASPLIPVDQQPTNPRDLWEMAYCPVHNWTSPMVVVNEYTTDVQGSLSASEQRWGLRGRPIRSVQASFGAWNPNEGRGLRNWLHRAQQCRFQMPLFSDQTPLTSAAEAGDSIITCDPHWRRFYAGGRVVIFLPGNVLASRFEVRKVLSVGPESISFDSALSQAWPKGSVIAPLLESRLMPNGQGRLLTDYVSELAVEAVEYVGASQLPSSATQGYIPPSFQSHDNLPILTGGVEWSQGIGWGGERDAGISGSGISSVETLYGSRARANFRIALRSLSREQAWRIIQFFDSRAGRSFPFWVVAPNTDYTLRGVVSDSLITLPTAGEHSDWSFQPWLAIQLHDDTIHIRKIDSVFRTGEDDILTLDQPIEGLSAEKVRRVAAAHKCRMASDSVTETWYTNEVMDTEFEAVEVLEEQPHEIGGMGMSSFAILDTLFMQSAVNAVRLSPPESGDDYYQWPLMPQRYSMRLFARGDGNYRDSSNERINLIPPAYTSGDWDESGKFGGCLKTSSNKRNLWVEGVLNKPPAEWTIELHFRPDQTIDSDTEAVQSLFAKYNKSQYSQSTSQWDMDAIELYFVAGSGRLAFYHAKGSQFGILATTQNTWQAGTWYHVAIVKSATHLTLYVDGTQAAQVAWDQEFGEGFVSDLEIGQRWWDGTAAFAGRIDEVRVSSTARAGGEIDPDNPYSPDADTLVLLHLNEEEGYEATNDVDSSALPGFAAGEIAEQAFEFDGELDLNFTNNKVLQLAPKDTETIIDLSLGCWVRRSRSGVVESLISKWEAEGDQQYLLQIDAANRVNVLLASPSGTASTISSTPIPNDGNWHLVVATWAENRDRGRVNIYIDGDEVQYAGERPMVERPLNYYSDGGPDLRVGGGPDGTYFAGRMAMVCLWAAKLLPTDVTRLFLHRHGNISAGQGPGVYGDRFIIGDPDRYYNPQAKRWVERRAEGEWEAKDTLIAEYRNDEWFFIQPDTAFITYDKSEVWMTRFYPREWFELYGHLETAI